MIRTIQIKRGTRAQIEAAKAAGQLRDGEPYLITDENRLAVGVSSSGYSSFAKIEELIDEKVAITENGIPGYLWGTTGQNGVLRTNTSIKIQKDINNSFVELAVADVDFGTF
jgi:hypothetical protein